MTTRAVAADMRIVGRTLLPGGELRLALVSLRDGRIDVVAPAVTEPEERAIRRTPEADGEARLRALMANPMVRSYDQAAALLRIINEQEQIINEAAMKLRTDVSGT
jgi:hypothetical protein